MKSLALVSGDPAGDIELKVAAPEASLVAAGWEVCFCTLGPQGRTQKTFPRETLRHTMAGTLLSLTFRGCLGSLCPQAPCLCKRVGSWYLPMPVLTDPLPQDRLCWDCHLLFLPHLNPQNDGFQEAKQSICKQENVPWAVCLHFQHLPALVCI